MTLLLQILDSTRIHLIPTLNPDGLKAAEAGNCDGGAGHKNAHDTDLDETFNCMLEIILCILWLLTWFSEGKNMVIRLVDIGGLGVHNFVLRATPTFLKGF